MKLKKKHQVAKKMISIRLFSNLKALKNNVRKNYKYFRNSKR